MQRQQTTTATGEKIMQGIQYWEVILMASVWQNSSPQLSGWGKTVSEYCQKPYCSCCHEKSSWRTFEEWEGCFFKSVCCLKKKCSCDFQKVYIHSFLSTLSPCCSQIPKLKKCGNLGRPGAHQLSRFTFSMHLKPSHGYNFESLLFLCLSPQIPPSHGFSDV